MGAKQRVGHLVLPWPIDSKTIGYLVAWGGYVLFASILLRLDTEDIKSLPNRTWQSPGPMWTMMILWTFLALLGALTSGAMLSAIIVRLAMGELEQIGVVIAAISAGLAVLLVSEIIRNLRARASATLLLDPR